MANEFKLNAAITPKILRHMGNGSRCSEVFTLNTDTKTSTTVNADGWQTEDTTNGRMYPVVSDGFSKLAVWWVSNHDASGTDVGPTIIVAGKRPFHSYSLLAAADGSIFDGHSAALNWFPCQLESAGDLVVADEKIASKHAFHFSVHEDPILADAIFYSGSTKIYGGPILDVRGTEQVAALVAVASANDGYVVGQFLE